MTVAIMMNKGLSLRKALFVRGLIAGSLILQADVHYEERQG